MWKRFAVIFIIVINICLLTGCYVDIDRQIMVSGIAIDVGQQGKKYHVSAETIVVSGDEITTDVIETDGNTVFETLRDFIGVSSKKLYFGHCKVIFISEEVAKEGIGEILDLAIRDQEARIDMDIIIAKGCDAKDLIMTEGVFSPIVSYKANDLFSTPEKTMGDAPALDVYKIFNDIYTDSVSAVIPAFELTNVEDKKDIKLCGTGVFKNDKLIGYLDKYESRSLSIIGNKLREGLLTYESKEKEDSFVSYEIMNNKSKTSLEFEENNKISVNVSTETKVNVGEIGIEADFMKTEDVEKTRQKLESQMEEDLYELIDKAQSDLNCDIFGIGREIYRNYPHQWEKYKENWEETFKTLDFNVDCKVEINSSGLIDKGCCAKNGSDG